jgi:hypothetical protein
MQLVQQTVDADKNTVKEYNCNFNAAGATVTGITVIEECEDDDYTHMLVYVDYTNKQVRDVYENAEFAKQVSAALGYAVEFTEEGMQEQGKASMEAYAD